MPISCTVNLALARASLVVGLNARRTGYNLCVRSIVTRLVNYPLTLCILAHFCCKLYAVTLAFGARGASLHPTTTIKRLGILLLWTFDHKLIPQSLLTARLGLGIQDVVEPNRPQMTV